MQGGVIMTTTRQYWLDTMVRIVQPVLENLYHGKLKERMPDFLK